MGNWNLLAADFDGLESLIKIGLVVLFMVGPYLLQLLGGKAVQDDRGNAAGNRRREPQSDLEREIADFLEQSRRGGTSSRTTAESVDAQSADDFVVAETAPETLRDRHLAPSAIETQSFGQPAEQQTSRSDQAYARAENTTEEFQYEEAESYNYDSEHPSQGSNAGAQIAAMFREPEKVRNAFILGEIINRPKFPRRS